MHRDHAKLLLQTYTFLNMELITDSLRLVHVASSVEIYSVHIYLGVNNQQARKCHFVCKKNEAEHCKSKA